MKKKMMNNNEKQSDEKEHVGKEDDEQEDIPHSSCKNKRLHHIDTISIRRRSFHL